MCKLNEEIVATFDGRHDLGEPILSYKAVNRLSRLGVVGDRYSGGKEARQHLPPRRPRLFILVDNRGIPCKVERRYILDLANGNGTHAGMGAVEFERQLVIPIQRANLTRLEFYACG